MLPRANVLGFDFIAVSMGEWQAELDHWLGQVYQRPLIVFTPNPEQVILAKNSPAFAKMLHKADVLLPDGAGLLWASRRHQTKPLITERLTGIDTMSFLLKKTNEQVLVIGGFTVPPSSQHLDWLRGYRDARNQTPEEEKILVTTLLEKKPSIVCIAFGAPYQERWIIKHLDVLKKARVKVVLTVGGAADILFGRLRRAPNWMQRFQLEWLYRLWQEPWRWRRQLALLQFIRLVLTEKAQVT